MNQLIAGTAAAAVLLACLFAAFVGWFALVDHALGDDPEMAELLEKRPGLIGPLAVAIYQRAWQNDDKDDVRWSFLFGHLFVGWIIWSLTAAAYHKAMEWLEGGPFYCNRCGEELPREKRHLADLPRTGKTEG